jgi:hypothetical protein
LGVAKAIEDNRSTLRPSAFPLNRKSLRVEALVTTDFLGVFVGCFSEKFGFFSHYVQRFVELSGAVHISASWPSPKAEFAYEPQLHSTLNH